MPKLKSHQQINQDSGNVEQYTPPHIIDCVRNILGTIDVDPASSLIANLTVKAKRFFTKENDILIPTLNRCWGICDENDNYIKPSKLFMNHPYSRTNNPLWINKLVKEYIEGWVEEGICLVFSSTSEGWFQPLYDYPICFIEGRVKHMDENGIKTGSSPKGSCLVYFGKDYDKFYEISSLSLGRVMFPTKGINEKK